jgi:hypothetical protein
MFVVSSEFLKKTARIGLKEAHKHTLQKSTFTIIIPLEDV